MNNFLSKVNWLRATIIGIFVALLYFVFSTSSFMFGSEVAFFPKEFLALLAILFIVWGVFAVLHIIRAHRETSSSEMAVPSNAKIPHSIVAGLLLGLLIMEIAPYIVTPINTALFNRDDFSLTGFTNAIFAEGMYEGLYGEESYGDGMYSGEGTYEEGYSDGFEAGRGLPLPEMSPSGGSWDGSGDYCGTSTYRDELRLDDIRSFARFLTNTHYTEHGTYPTSLDIIAEFYSEPTMDEYGYYDEYEYYDEYGYLTPQLDYDCDQYTIRDYTRYFYTLLDGGKGFQIGANLENKIEGALDTGCNGETDRYCYYVKPQQL